MENVNIMWVHWKIHFLGGGRMVTKNPNILGAIALKGGLDSLQI